MFAAASPPHQGLGRFDYATILLYLIGTISIALYFARRQRSTEEFFLGGRRMPWFAVGLSIIATLLSTNGYLGIPGEMIKHGITLSVGVLAIPLSALVIFPLWVPFFMRLRLTSVYEYLEHRFNYGMRLLGALLFIFMQLGYMAVVVYTSSMALSEMLKPSIPGEMPELRNNLIYWVIISVGIFATAYTAVGGMRAVIWTDVVQFAVLFSGLLITLGYVIATTGTGPLQWWAAVDSHATTHTTPIFFSSDITERTTIVTTIISVFVWAVCTHLCSQVVLQRYFSTTSLKAARRSYLLAAMAETTVLALLWLCGLALLSFYLSHPSYLPFSAETGLREVPTSNYADKVFPYFIGNQLPTGLGGLILAALIAAAMSSIDSGVNSISAVITTDIFQHLYPEGHTKISKLTLARILTLVIGFSCTALACGVTTIVITRDINIIEVMQPAFNMFLGPLASLFLIGMFFPRCTVRTTLPAVLTSMVVAAIWNYWEAIGRIWAFCQKFFGITWGPTMTAENVPTFLLSTAGPCLAALVVAAVGSLLFESGKPHSGSDHSWWAVMRRDPAEVSTPATDGAS